MINIDTRYNPANEISKYNFFEQLEHSEDGKDPKTIKQYVAAVHEFEVATGFKDFKKYTSDWAIDFKDYLNDKLNSRTGEHISKSLYFNYISFVRQLFEWLVKNQKDYAKIKDEHIKFLHVTRNDKNKAKATGYQESHEIHDILASIRNMPESNEIEMRNKALVSLCLLTTPRISSLQEGRIERIKYFKDLDTWAFLQDPRLQNTKYSKFITSFFVGHVEDIIQNVLKWKNHLISKGHTDKGFLFPKIKSSFTRDGAPILELTKECIKSQTQIRIIIKDAFVSNNLSYLKQHSFRHSITRKMMKGEDAAERLMALAENEGHKGGMATLVASYGGNYLAKQARLLKEFELE